MIGNLNSPRGTLGRDGLVEHLLLPVGRQPFSDRLDLLVERAFKGRLDGESVLAAGSKESAISSIGIFRPIAVDSRRGFLCRRLIMDRSYSLLHLGKLAHHLAGCLEPHLQRALSVISRLQASARRPLLLHASALEYFDASHGLTLPSSP